MSFALEGKYLSFYADENKNLIFIPCSKNPDYDEEREREKEIAWEKHRQEMVMKGVRVSHFPPNKERPYLPAQHAIVLQYPYTPEEVLAACVQYLEDTDKYPPYKDKKKDDMQLYYKIGSFREATYGKRMISASWKLDEKIDPTIRVDVLLPCKRPYQWMGVEKIVLPPETATPIMFAEAMIDVATRDMTKFKGFKTFKRTLNLTPPKPREKKK